jgi:hypothetical protein
MELAQTQIKRAVVSFLAFWYLPKNGYEASFLPGAEKKLACTRLHIVSSYVVGRMGYDKIKANLYTVAPNISGAAVLLVLASTRIRFPFIVLGFLLTFTVFVVFATIDVEHSIHVPYYGCYMKTWGTSAPSMLLSTWYNNNVADENKRVTLTSGGVPLANLMAVVSFIIFRTQDQPKYIPALPTTAAFGVTGALAAGLLGC